jgi:hypothetical protein
MLDIGAFLLIVGALPQLCEFLGHFFDGPSERRQLLRNVRYVVVGRQSLVILRRRLPSSAGSCRPGATTRRRS